MTHREFQKEGNMNPSWSQVTVLRQSQNGAVVKSLVTGKGYFLAGKQKVREAVATFSPGHVFNLFGYPSNTGKSVIGLAVHDYNPTTEQIAA